MGQGTTWLALACLNRPNTEEYEMIYFIQVTDPFETLVGPFPTDANANYFIQNYLVGYDVQGDVIPLSDTGSGGTVPIDTSRQLTPEAFIAELDDPPLDDTGAIDASVDRYQRAIERATP